MTAQTIDPDPATQGKPSQVGQPCEVQWCRRTQADHAGDEVRHHMTHLEPFTTPGGRVSGLFSIDRYDDATENPDCSTTLRLGEVDGAMSSEDLVELAMFLLRKAAHLRILDDPSAVPASTPSRTPTIWQTEPCPAWCNDPHADNDHPDDRWHWGSERHVPLRLEPAGEMAQNEYQLATVRVLPRQHAYGRRTVVHFVSDDIEVKPVIEFDMLPSEAAELASALLDVVAEVEPAS